MTLPINHPDWRDDKWEISLGDAPIIGRDGYKYNEEAPDKKADGELMLSDFGWSLVQHIENLIEFIAAPIGWILEGVQGVIDFVSPAFQAVFAGVTALLSDIVNFFTYSLGSLFGRGSGEVGERWSPFKDDIDGALAPLKEILDENFALIDEGIADIDVILDEQAELVRRNEELEKLTGDAITAAETVTENLDSYRTELLNAIGPELNKAREELEEAKSGLATREEVTTAIGSVNDAQEQQWRQMAQASIVDFEGTFEDFLLEWRNQQISWNETQQTVNEKQEEWNAAADGIDAAQTAAIDAQQRILDLVFPAQSAVPLIPGTSTPEWYQGMTPMSGVTPPSGATDKSHFVQSSGSTFDSTTTPDHFVKVVPGQRYRASAWIRRGNSNSRFEVYLIGKSGDTIDRGPIHKHVQVLPTLSVGGETLDSERVVRLSSSGMDWVDFNQHSPSGTGWVKVETHFYFKENIDQVSVRNIGLNSAAYTTSLFRFGDLEIWPDLPSQAKVDNAQNQAMRNIEQQIEGVNDYIGRDLSVNQRQNSLMGLFDKNDEILAEMQDEMGEFIPRFFYGTPGSSSTAMGSELLTVNRANSEIQITGKKTGSGDSWTGRGVLFYEPASSNENGAQFMEVTFRSGSTTRYTVYTADFRDPVFIAWQMTKGRQLTRTSTSNNLRTMSQIPNWTTILTMNIPSNAEIQSLTLKYWLENAHNGSEYRIGYSYGNSGIKYLWTKNIGPLTSFGSGRRLMENSYGRIPNNGGTDLKLYASGSHSGSAQRQFRDASLTVTYVEPA